jgi:beta-galactosidase
VVKKGRVEKLNLKPDEKTTIRIPVGLLDAAADYALTLRYKLADDTRWAEAGHEVASEQFVLQKGVPQVTQGQGAVRLEDQPAVLDVVGKDFSVCFDKKTGIITSIQTERGECIAQHSYVKGPQLNVYRSPIDNDRWFRGDWAKVQLWRTDAELAAFDASRAPDGSAKIRVQRRYAFEGGHIDHQTEYSIFGNGVIKIASNVTPEGEALLGLEALPRIGLKLALDPAMEQVEWYGRGPHENYPDRKTSAFFGKYESTATDMFTPYLNPQESGARSDVSRVTLSSPDGKGPSLTVESSEPFLFSALHYDALDLGKVIRPSFLQERDEVILCIDHKMLGLGNGSCGPVPLKKYMLPVQPVRFDFTLRIQ